jgi:hypothetical protein
MTDPAIAARYDAEVTLPVKAAARKRASPGNCPEINPSGPLIVSLEWSRRKAALISRAALPEDFEGRRERGHRRYGARTEAKLGGWLRVSKSKERAAYSSAAREELLSHRLPLVAADIVVVPALRTSPVASCSSTHSGLWRLWW